MKRIIVLLLVFAFVSCEDDIVIPDDGIYQDNALATELKSRSQASFKFNGDSYKMEAYAWRDFMPVSPPDGKPMISINRLINQNSNPIVGDLEMIKQYVIYNQSVWVAEYEENSGDSSVKWQKEKVSRNGPNGGRVFM